MRKVLPLSGPTPSSFPSLARRWPEEKSLFPGRHNVHSAPFSSSLLSHFAGPSFVYDTLRAAGEVSMQGGEGGGEWLGSRRRRDGIHREGKM